MARQVLTIPDVPPTLLQSATAAATYVAKAGDVMTGTLGVFLTGTAVQAQRVADSYPRVVLGTNVNSAGGGIEFGSGSVGLDTRIFRNGPAQLQTNAQWDNNLVLKESSAWAFRHGASNFGTPIYAQFGYGGDGNNPRMQFGCNAWFAPYGGTRGNPTKQVTGLASGLMIVEAGGSGGQPAGMVPLTDFIWQDGGWTTQYQTALRLYNGGSIRLRGDTGNNTVPEAWLNVRNIVDGGVFFMARGNGLTTPSRLGQFYAGTYTYLSTNAKYVTPDWLLDDTTQDGAVISLGGAPGGNTFTLYRYAAGANPASGRGKTPVVVGANGMMTLTPDVGVGALTANGSVSANPGAGQSGFYMPGVPDTWIQMGNIRHYVTPGSGHNVWQRWDGVSWKDVYRLVYSVPGVRFSEKVVPYGDNVVACGAAGEQWASVSTYGLSSNGAMGITVGGNIVLSVGGTYVHPSPDGSIYLGHPSYRYQTIYVVSAPVVGSSLDLKERIAPLDPSACAAAVMDTDWVAYDYKTPAGLTQEVMAQTDASRHQKGYVLGSPDHRVSGLFGLSDRQNRSDGADLAVVACALQNALVRIAQLEAREA